MIGVICGPALLFLTFIRGDLKTTIDFPYLFSPGFMVLSFQTALFSANKYELNAFKVVLLLLKCVLSAFSAWHCGFARL